MKHITKYITISILSIGALWLFAGCALFPNTATIKIKNTARNIGLGGTSLTIIGSTATFNDVYLDISESTTYKKEKKDIDFNKDHTFTITWYGKAKTNVLVKSGSATIKYSNGNPDDTGKGKTLCTISDVINKNSITKTITFTDGEAKC